jgi:hypothetical protein
VLSIICPSLRTLFAEIRASLELQVSLNKRLKRYLPLLSIYVQFPKLDVAGSIPVSRSWFQELGAAPALAFSIQYVILFPFERRSLQAGSHFR